MLRVPSLLGAAPPPSEAFGLAPPPPPPALEDDVEAPEPAPVEREKDLNSLTGCCLIENKIERAKALVNIGRQWEEAVRHLWPAWHEAGGMTYGDQYGSYNAQLGVWETRTRVSEKKITRIELNHMAPICEDVATLQCQDLPNMRATTPTTSASAASAALCADQLVWHLWELDDYDSKNVELREAAAVFGNIWLFPRWDPTGGRLVEQVVGSAPEFDQATGQLVMKDVKQKVREGCFEDEIVSCFEGLKDPCSKGKWDGEGFIIHQQFSLATAKRLYPAHADKFAIAGSPGGNEGAYYNQNLHNASPRAGGINAKDDRVGKKVDQWTFFVRTSDDFYRGRWVVVVSNVIVFEGDNPVYPTEEEEARGEEFPPYHWPCWQFSHKTISGSSLGQGIALRMIGPQKKLNGVASKKLHMLKRTSHPTLVKPRGADFVKTDEPDQQINVPRELQPGSIYYLNSPGIPQELQLEERLSVEQMETIAGIHAGTRGASESGDSGSKTRLLFQRDLGRLASVKYRHDKQLGQAFSYKLRLFRRYATVARTIRIVGENNAVSVKSFDMSSIAAGTDIVVYQDNGLPRDPSSRMLHIEKAVQLGIVDPKDPVQRASLAEVIGLASTFNQWHQTQIADRRCAEDENIRLYEGEMPRVEFWQDDLQHLAVHFAEMNSETWRRSTEPKPDDDPETAAKKQTIRSTWLAHIQATQAQIARKSAPPPGLLPGPGAPSGGLPTSPPGGPPPGASGPTGPDAGPPPPPPQAPAGPPEQKVAA